MVHLTFEVECLVPPGVECAPLDLGLESVLLVGQQRHPHVRVRQPVRVLRREVLRLWDMGMVYHTMYRLHVATSFPCC